MNTTNTTKGSSGSQSAPTSLSRLLIVEDHPIVLEGYLQLLSREPGLEVCGSSGEEFEALQQLRATHPDLAVIDISLKEGSGIELIKQIKTEAPAVKILVVSAHDESLFAERVLQAGALGYVNKQEATDQLVEAIRTVLQGEIYLSSRMTERLVHRAVGWHKNGGDHSAIEGLSNRELEVFELIGEGLATRQIAGKLHLSPKTVETYRENIKAKLNYQSSAELTRHAVQWVLEAR